MINSPKGVDVGWKKKENEAQIHQKTGMKRTFFFGQRKASSTRSKWLTDYMKPNEMGLDTAFNIRVFLKMLARRFNRGGRPHWSSHTKKEKSNIPMSTVGLRIFTASARFFTSGCG